jgi:hypothetical protein
VSEDDLATARALGELSAQLSSVGRSLDLLRTECAEQRAQISEVKDDQRAAREASAVQAERLSNHLEADETNHTKLVGLIGKVQTGLDDLLTWRGKILGGLAVIGILVGIFGHYVAELMASIWHSAVK